MATLDGVVARLIDARRRTPRESDDLLTALIAAHDGRKDGGRLLRDEVVSMIAAGHESTACALAWCLCLLSRHPEAARRMRAEVDTVLGGREPDAGDRSEEHPSELQSLMRLSYAVFCLNKQKSIMKQP